MCPLSCLEKSFFSLSADVLLLTGERPNFLQKSKNNTKQPFSFRVSTFKLDQKLLALLKSFSLTFYKFWRTFPEARSLRWSLTFPRLCRWPEGCMVFLIPQPLQEMPLVGHRPYSAAPDGHGMTRYLRRLQNYWKSHQTKQMQILIWTINWPWENFEDFSHFVTTSGVSSPCSCALLWYSDTFFDVNITTARCSLEKFLVI